MIELPQELSDKIILVASEIKSYGQKNDSSGLLQVALFLSFLPEAIKDNCEHGLINWDALGVYMEKHLPLLD